jgi:hypothetical protein
MRRAILPLLTITTTANLQKKKEKIIYKKTKKKN